MNQNIIDRAESFCDGLRELPQDYTDLQDLLVSFAEGIIWHGPDEVPVMLPNSAGSYRVLNQNDEVVYFDHIRKNWYRHQGYTASKVIVTNWRYPEPEKMK